MLYRIASNESGVNFGAAGRNFINLRQ